LTTMAAAIPRSDFGSISIGYLEGLVRAYIKSAYAGIWLRTAK
jgi:hypothetical protein